VALVIVIELNIRRERAGVHLDEGGSSILLAKLAALSRSTAAVLPRRAGCRFTRRNPSPGKVLTISIASAWSRTIDVLANLRICRKMASALGISSIVFGVALVCSGLIMRPRISQTQPAGVDGPIEFRAVIDALIEEEDRRLR
jgi:hypothetical protein